MEEYLRQKLQYFNTKYFCKEIFSAEMVVFSSSAHLTEVPQAHSWRNQWWEPFAHWNVLVWLWHLISRAGTGWGANPNSLKAQQWCSQARCCKPLALALRKKSQEFFERWQLFWEKTSESKMQKIILVENCHLTCKSTSACWCCSLCMYCVSSPFSGPLWSFSELCRGSTVHSAEHQHSWAPMFSCMVPGLLWPPVTRGRQLCERAPVPAQNLCLSRLWGPGRQQELAPRRADICRGCWLCHGVWASCHCCFPGRDDAMKIISLPVVLHSPAVVPTAGTKCCHSFFLPFLFFSSSPPWLSQQNDNRRWRQGLGLVAELNPAQLVLLRNQMEKLFLPCSSPWRGSVISKNGFPSSNLCAR